MALGLLGKKVGTTRVFRDDGCSVLVTVIEVDSNRVTQIKSLKTDGYNAIQLTAGKKKNSRVNQPEAGHFAKAKVEAGDIIREFRVDDVAGYELGQVLDIALFEQGQKVDVTGQSKGKGFQGGIKRWNFHMQDATHGNSLSHRALGSIGQCQTPGRVFKGKKMAGHMGAERVTVQSLEIEKLYLEKGLILIKGSVPGHSGQFVMIKPATKSKA